LRIFDACDICASIPRVNGFVEVDVQAPTQQEMPSIETAAALAQKANSRL
jgi:hypothetical protein